MANRYAVANGNFSNPAIWDNGAVPLSGDSVYANGFTIVVDQNITANILSNSVPAIAVPDIATPIMLSDISPSGIVFSSGFFPLRDAYLAFTQDNNFGTFWQSGVTNTGILGYQYPTGKIIKRYAIKGISNNNEGPRTWTFEGSNDGISYTILETVTNLTLGVNGVYISSILSNSTSYIYYRINITASGVAGNRPSISEFEMTESEGIVLGVNNGGRYNHTSGGFTISANTLTAGTSNLITYNHTSGTNVLNIANNVLFNFLGIITITSGDVDISIPTIITLNLSFAGGLVKNGTGVLNFIGNITAQATSQTNNAFQLNSGTVNMTGNINSSTGTNGNQVGIILAGATLTITGNVTGGSGQLASNSPHGITQTSGNLTIIGNVTTIGGFGTAHGINQTGGDLTVIGNVTGGTGDLGIGISSSTSGIITVTGTITSGATSIGLSSSSRTATVQVSGPLINTNGFNALYAVKYFITGASTTIIAQSSVGVNNVFYNNTSTLDALLASNVRNGISFGLGGALTGTLKVPLPSQVIVGVETDDTVGTWALVPQDFWNYATSNLTDPNGIGARLKNVSTVDTTGEQLEALL